MVDSRSVQAALESYVNRCNTPDTSSTSNRMDEDISIIEQHTSTSTIHSRSTRFTAIRTYSQPSIHLEANTAGISRIISSPIPQQKNNEHTNTSATNTFRMPRLVDGTKMLSEITNNRLAPLRAPKSKAYTRFSGTNARGSVALASGTAPQNYEPIVSQPISEDEKVLFTSIQVLKERVARLEAEKSEFAQRSEEDEQALATLRRELAAARSRSDSGFGSSDDEYSTRKRTNAKVQYRTSISSLQAAVKKAERKTSSRTAAQREADEKIRLQIKLKQSEERERELVQVVDRVRTQKLELAAEVEQLMFERDEIRAEKEEAEQREEMLTQEVEQLKAKNHAEVVLLTSEKDAALAQLKTKVEELQAAKNVKRSLEDIRAANKRTQKEHEEKEKVIAENEMLKAELKNAQDDAEHRKKAVLAVKEQAERDVERAKFQQNSAESNLQHVQDMHEKLKARMKEMSEKETASQQATFDKSKLEAEVELLKMELGEAKAHAQHYMESNRYYNDGMDNLATDLKNVEKERCKLLAENNRLYDKFKVAEKRIEGLERNNNALYKREAQYIEQLREANRQLEKFDKEHARFLRDLGNTTELTIYNPAAVRDRIEAERAL